MYGCGGNRGFVQVSNGKTNGRSFTDALTDGKITMTGFNDRAFVKRTVIVKDGQIWDNKLTKDGKTVFHIIYGQFFKDKRTIVHFNPKTGTGKHGKARRYEKLFGHDGVCHSWYKQGRLIRQKFIYDNMRLAYDYSPFKDEFIVKDYEGKEWAVVKGRLQGRIDNALNESHSVLGGKMEFWFSQSSPFEVTKNGKPFFKGEYTNGQRSGQWFVDGKEYFYEHGVQFPKKLYYTPPEKLKPEKILKIENAQLRMALMSKISVERLAECGTIVSRGKNNMLLLDIPNYDTRLLRVQCTTTKAFYFLKVPKDAKRCEQARQWTFGVGDYLNKPIKFEVET